MSRLPLRTPSTSVDPGLVCRVLGSDAGETVDPSAAESVTGAFEGEDAGVVDDSVDHCGGDDLVAEDAAPAGEGQVRGEPSSVWCCFPFEFGRKIWIMPTKTLLILETNH